LGGVGRAHDGAYDRLPNSYNLTCGENVNAKRSLIGLMLMAVSAGAMAEWTKIGGTDDFDEYADLSTIRKSGNTAKMWELRDFKKAQTSTSNGKSYLSDMTRREYDCNEEKYNLLSLYQYSGNMRNGDIVLSGENSDSRWTSIPPGSMVETTFKIACGAK